mgnify:CR=1 FL=1
MDIGLHQIVQRRVDRPVPGDRGHSGEGGADHSYAIVAAAIPGAFVTDVVLTVVDHVQLGRRERSLQPPADRFHPLFARQLPRDRIHGNTARNGRTSTRA